METRDEIEVLLVMYFFEERTLEREIVEPVYKSISWSCKSR